MEILWNYNNNLCTFLTFDFILFSSFCDNLFYGENFNSVTMIELQHCRIFLNCNIKTDVCVIPNIESKTTTKILFSIFTKCQFYWITNNQSNKLFVVLSFRIS